MTVTPITSKQQFDELVASGKPFIIDFWATWCGPCRMISPVFEKLSDGKDGHFYKVDVDDQAEIAQEVGIRAMPTFISFKDGNKHGEVVGANPPKLQNLVTTVLA